MNPADIASIELGGLPPAATAASDHPEPAVVAVGGSTQVNQGILIAYDSAMPTQPAADVTYSLLFAQLAADAQNDRRTAPDAWMSVWLDVLQGVGWIVERDNRPPGRELPLGTEWPALVTGLLPTSAAQLCAGGMAVAQKLPPTAPGMKVWGRSIAGADRAMFIPAAALATRDPTIAAVAVAWQLHQELTTFFTWSLAFLAQFRSVQMTLNETVYSRLRQDIIARLGTAPATYVVELTASRQEIPRSKE
ncbi:MAG: hypothetical protein U0Q21_04470 [Dermatophilaceae bacterium]